jgi:hypothetical protein
MHAILPLDMGHRGLALGKVMDLWVWWPESGPSPLQEREQEERREREAFANLRAEGGKCNVETATT